MEENKKAKSKFNVKKLITNDKYLIILSLALAIIIWTVTSINVGVDQEKTIKVEVPIKLGNQVADNLGMQFYSSQETVQISVKLRGAKYMVGQVNEEDLKINFDTSAVSKTGEQAIPILISSANDRLEFNIEDYYPTQVNGYFDVSETKTVDVTANYNRDFVPKGYTVGKPIMTDEQIVVTGPKTYVDKVQGAAVNISVPNAEKLTEQYKGEYPIEIIGDGIEYKYLTLKSKTNDVQIDKIGVTLPVLKVCKLPVVAKLEGTPANLDPNAITITCKPDIINAGILDTAGIQEATAGVINFNEIPAGGKTFYFDPSTLNGITVLDDIESIEVKVDVNKDYIEKDVYVDMKDIELVGVPDGYKAVVKSMSSDAISVITNADNVSSIKSSSISMKCDLSKSSSNNVYTVDVVLNDKSSWVYSTYTAVIELKQEK